MKKQTLLIISLLILFSCGKENAVETPEAFIERTTQPKSETQEETKDDLERESKNDTSALPALPSLKIEILKASMENLELSVGEPKNYITILKNKIFNNIDVTNTELDILNNSMIYSSNEELEVLSHFKNAREANLELELDIKSDKKDLGVENIVIDFHVFHDEIIHPLQSVIIAHKENAKAIIDVSKNIHKLLLQKKAYIGMTIKEFTFFKDGQTYSSNEYDKKDYTYILGDKFERVSGQEDLNVMKDGEQIYMLKGLPNTTTQLHSSLSQKSAQRYLGMWKKSNSIYAYIRNADTKLNQNTYYKINTHHKTFKQETYNTSESLTYFLAMEMGSILSGVRIKSNHVINGYTCYDNQIGSLSCKKNDKDFFVSLKKKNCSITRSKIKPINYTNLNTSLIDYKKNHIIQSFVKNNSLYVKASQETQFIKKARKSQDIPVGAIKNNCSYRKCSYQQSGCFLDGNLNLNNKRVTDQITLTIVKKK